MKLMSGTVLLKITAEDKRKVFQQDVGSANANGILFTGIEETEEGMAETFAQSVQSALVIAVADDVKHIQPGDIAILDYVVDTMPELIVHKDEAAKIVCVDTRTVYHDDDNIVYASLRSKNDMYVWSKGDVDTASLIYGVFRDDQLIPNAPYVFCEHREFRIRSTSPSGVVYDAMEEDTVIRRILVPNEHSDPELEPGTLVVVQRHTLYERTLDGKMFDVIMDQDIEIAIE
jgi:hypothetical protein